MGGVLRDFHAGSRALTAIIPTVAVRQVHTTPTVRMMVLLGAAMAKSDVVIRTYKHNCDTRQHVMNDGKLAKTPHFSY